MLILPIEFAKSVILVTLPISARRMFEHAPDSVVACGAAGGRLTDHSSPTQLQEGGRIADSYWAHSMHHFQRLPPCEGLAAGCNRQVRHTWDDLVEGLPVGSAKWNLASISSEVRRFCNILGWNKRRPSHAFVLASTWRKLDTLLFHRNDTRKHTMWSLFDSRPHRHTHGL
jgi:hypothetical protein